MQLLPYRVQLRIELLHLVVVLLGHGALMVTEHGHLLVGAVVLGDLLINGHVGVHVLVQQGVEGHARVVRAEYLGGQPRHEALEVVVEDAHVELEDLIPIILPLAVLVHPPEQLDVLVHLRQHLGGVLVPDAVLTQEVELEGAGRLQHHVLHLEGAAAHGVRLVVILVVPGTQRELVDEVGGHRHLLHDTVLRVELGCVVLPDRFYVVPQVASLLVLLLVAVRLEPGVGG
mmetsp:Transcript_35205/g.111257  ORF Transcript_35205/g.111257 Transcript_35205/m.111257 type:complete len:230 (-) Transcript_35205:867-1556(-)